MLDPTLLTANTWHQRRGRAMQ